MTVCHCNGMCASPAGSSTGFSSEPSSSSLPARDSWHTVQTFTTDGSQSDKHNKQVRFHWSLCSFAKLYLTTIVQFLSKWSKKWSHFFFLNIFFYPFVLWQHFFSWGVRWSQRFSSSWVDQERLTELTSCSVVLRRQSAGKHGMTSHLISDITAGWCRSGTDS